MIDSNGDWHFQPSFDLPAHNLNILQVVLVNVGTSDGDLIAWVFYNNGNFTLRSAYIAAKGLNALNPLLLIYRGLEAKSASEIHYFYMAMYIQ